jgi:pSer/pThr/pTyr-binding forkhead associated (FHA) protein
MYETILFISGRHAHITRQGAQWYIADLGSTNKTYVNGAKLAPNTPVPLKTNDVLALANITFTAHDRGPIGFKKSLDGYGMWVNTPQINKRYAL